MTFSSPPTLAAIDLGSNSFHMKVVRYVNGQMDVIDRMKEMVRLAGGLDEQNRLTPEATERALACLSRFGQRLRDVPAENVRAVGTNTLRRARNSRGFLRRAKAALGHPIDIIAGREEARMIYLGVAHSASQDDGQRLVVDIGGGSTEVIIGREFAPVAMESLFMGCVSMSQQYFANGEISWKNLRAAQLAAHLELEPIREQFKAMGWTRALGASGTIHAVHNVLTAMGLGDLGITLDGLNQLETRLIEAGNFERLVLEGLQPERAPVFVGGVAVLRSVFEALDIRRMDPAGGALREGLLYDLIGRFSEGDVRELTIGDLLLRYRIDQDQAARVEHTATQLRIAVAASWRLHKKKYADLLHWAALLHEMGLAIAHTQYHKHGAYVLEHADLPGFSRQEQQWLGVLVRTHRRKFRVGLFRKLSESRKRLRRLAVLLRVAVVLHRMRTNQAVPLVQARADGDRLALDFPDGWLEAHPLTLADLQQEAVNIKPAGFVLEFA